MPQKKYDTQKISQQKSAVKKSLDEDKEIHCHQPFSPTAASNCQVTQTLPSIFVVVARAVAVAVTIMGGGIGVGSGGGSSGGIAGGSGSG
jgi:hypothetical protein